MNPPLVAVFMVTYNHEDYICQAIESVLMQVTSFPIKLFIGEDCSTDQTKKLCLKYEKVHPDIISVTLNMQNLGATKNAKQMYNICFLSGAKYIAMLEGDDYWTDPFKLQKQVDFLELNEEFAICFHNTKVFDNEEQKTLFEQPGIVENTILSIHDFLKNNPIATASVIFRRKYIEFIPSWFNQSPFGDYVLYLFILEVSKLKAGYLKDLMAVYRIHTESMHGKVHLANADFVPAYKQHLDFWKLLNKHLFKGSYKEEINRTLASNYRQIIKYLLLNNRYFEAFKYNTLFLIKLHFSYINENARLYKQILRNTYK